jgi:ABC-type Fe3+/spermidine/putrescine transport system ATPase subunit
MLDEPLGSLDRALREELMAELRGILKQVGVTTIYVTHDQQEAFAVADRVAIMRRGRILQEGTPQSVYRNPAMPWVARFLGQTNLVEGRVVSRQPLCIETAMGRFTLGEGCPFPASSDVTLLLRPEAGRLWEEQCDTVEPILEAKVRGCSFRGSRYRLLVQHESGIELTFELVSRTLPAPGVGDMVSLALDMSAASLLEGRDDDQALL